MLTMPCAVGVLCVAGVDVGNNNDVLVGNPRGGVAAFEEAAQKNEGL